MNNLRERKSCVSQTEGLSAKLDEFAGELPQDLPDLATAALASMLATIRAQTRDVSSHPTQTPW